MSVEILPLNPELFPGMLDLMHQYQCFYGSNTSREKNHRFFWDLYEHPERGGQLLAKSPQGILGFTTLYRSHSTLSASLGYELNDLFIIPESRGQGLARKLIQASFLWARDQGGTFVSWKTAPDNLPAQSLYQSLGYSGRNWICYRMNHIFEERP